MIVPMKKVSLMIMGDKKKETLKKLRKLGILHIEITEGSGKKLEELKEQISLIESAIFSVSEKKNKNIEMKDASKDEVLNISKEIASLAEEKKTCLSEKITLSGEIERIKNWGEINPEIIAELKCKGVEVAFYEMPKTEYDTLSEAVKTVSIEKTKNSVKFLLIKTGNEGEEEVIDSLRNYRFELPKISNQEITLKIEEKTNRIAEIDEKIASYAGYAKSMKNAIKTCEKEIEFEVYATGMADENLSDEDKEDFRIAYFTGYVEEENLARLKETAKENSWGLIVSDPTEEDNVPTKLKNNKFVSLIYPLTDFLGTVPGYFEYDISGWFLFFFTIFFGMIFGDGGYGLLVTIVALIMMLKAKMKGGKISPLLGLVTLVGFATVVWGAVTCTWFGFTPEQLPQWVKNLSIPVISNVYADAIWQLPWTKEGVGLTTAQNMQIFCFALALFQLSVAHIKGIKSNLGSLKVLGEVGALMQLWGLFYVVLMMVVNGEVFALNAIMINGTIPIGIIFVALVLVGFILSFVFSNYEGSVGQSVLESCKNIISVLLGVVNVFSDIVSYIRLWAVGLAGAAISSTVNEMAGPLLGHAILFIAAIALLVFGHGLNMILNLLSVIVHGVRLNTLEFSSHLGMSWSGFKYNPFRESGK